MSQPSIFIVHGDDETAVAVFLQERVAALGDSGIAELNLSRLDARQASDEELRAAACAIPFLADRRLLILMHPLARLATKDAQEQFCAFLQNLPPTGEIVLVIEDRLVYRRGTRAWGTLNDQHWLVKWAAGQRERARLVPFPLPTQQEMPGWIRKQAQEIGGQFTPAAAYALAGYVENNTRLAKLEIEKLLNFVDYRRPVEPDDIELLTANTSQGNIFEMVDALSSGDPRNSLRLLHKLLEEEDEFALFGMVVRQFRLLLLTREILDEGGRLEQVMQELRLPKFSAEKFTGQARRFSVGRLEQIYRRLLEIDEALKTSQITFPLAMDTFVAEMISA